MNNLSVQQSFIFAPLKQHKVINHFYKNMKGSIMKIVILFILFSSLILAQDGGFFSGAGGRAYIDISTGPSFPLNNFGDDNPNNQRSGYAQTGYSVGLSGGIRFLNLFEISVVGFRNAYGTNLDNLIESFNQSNPGAGFNASSDSWEIYGILGGFGLSYPEGHGFFGDVKVLGGYLNSTSPEIMLRTSSEDTYAKIESSTSSSLIYYFSGAVRRVLSDRLHLSLGLQYIWGSADFKNVKTITSIGGNINESTASFQRNMYAWGLTLGLRFILF